MIARILAVTLMILICGVAHAVEPAHTIRGWTLTELEPMRFLFEKPKEHLTVLINIDAVQTTDEATRDYILSPKFIQDGKNSRTNETLGVSPEGFGLQVTREQVGPQWIGVTESTFQAGDKLVVMSERWWVKSGLSVHFLIGSVGNVRASNDSQQKIFEEFQEDMGLRQTKSVWWKLLSIDEAKAVSETGRGRRSAKLTPVRRQESGPAPKPFDCAKQAATLGIKPNLIRKGPPTIHPEMSWSTCGQGAKRVYDDAKKWTIATGETLARRTERVMQISGCLASVDPAKSKSSAAWGWNWETTVRILKSAPAMVLGSQCVLVASNIATAYTLGKGALAAGKGLATAAVAVAPYTIYLTPMGQAKLGYDFAQYLTSTNDPMRSMYDMISAKFRPFTCLSDAEQTKVACKIITRTVAEIAATVATGGAAGAAVRIARIGMAVEEGVEAARAAEAVSEIADTGEALTSADRGASAARTVAGEARGAAEREVVGPPKGTKIPCVTNYKPTLWLLFEETANASPCTNPPNFDKLWRSAEKLESRAETLQDELAGKSLSASERSDAIREMRTARREAGEAYEKIAEMTADERNRMNYYKYAMESFASGGDGEALARVALDAVRSGKDVHVIDSQLESLLKAAEHRLTSAPDDLIRKAEVSAARAAKKEFEARSASAAKLAKESPLPKPASVPLAAVPKPVPPPVVPVPAKILSLADQATAARLAGRSDEAGELFLKSAKVRDVSDPAYRAALSESLNGQGTVARSMVQEAVSSNGPKKINELVLRLTDEMPKTPSDWSRMSEARRTSLLRTVQEVRRLDATAELYTPQQNMLRSMESSLIRDSENPLTAISSGKVAEATRLYAERIAEGWPKPTVERELRQQILSSTMMRDAVLRNTRRLPAGAAHGVQYWERLLQTQNQVLRNLNAAP